MTEIAKASIVIEGVKGSTTKEESYKLQDVSTVEQGYDETDYKPIASIPETKAKRQLFFQRGTIIEHIRYFCALSIASYVGVLTRIYLSLLYAWDGVPFFPSLYPTIVGTVIMGFIISHKNYLQARHKVLYLSIATGLCGSITTFSAWNSELAVVILQLHETEIDNVTRIIGSFTVIIIGVGMSLAGLDFGKHLASLSPLSDSRTSNGLVSNKGSPLDKCTTLTLMLTWILLSVAGIVITHFFVRYDLMFSIILSAFGTYLRWHLAPLNNLFKQFPLGTLIANIFGTWLLASLLVIQDYLLTTGLSRGDIVYQLLIGLGIGFCGCLTTVSTFAVELRNLSLKYTYIYAISSIFIAQLGLNIIRGSYHWVNNTYDDTTE